MTIIGCAGGGYFIWNHGIYRTIVTYWLVDAIYAPSADNLMLGSSSILRIDPNLLSACGSWLNRGIGASTIEHLTKYIEYSRLSISPERVLIYAGENDVSRGNFDTEMVLGNYRSLLGLIRKKYPLADIHILAIKPSPARRSNWEEYAAINAYIEQSGMRGKLWQVHHGDWQKYSINQPPLFLPDGVHLTVGGYKVFLGEFSGTCQNR